MDFNNLIKNIRKSQKIDIDFQNYLVDYVTGVRDKTRINDFVDFDLLNRIILRFINGDVKNDKKTEKYMDIFQEIIYQVSLVLPAGNETEDFEKKKNIIVNGSYIFDPELYSALGFSNYYIITKLIEDRPERFKYKDAIRRFAITISPYGLTEDAIRRDIISFICGLSRITGDVEEYLEERIQKVEERHGVYRTLDELDVATISDNLKRMVSLVRRAENLLTNIANRENDIARATTSSLDRISAKEKDALDSISSDIESLKDATSARLDEYLETLKKDMKGSANAAVEDVIKEAIDKMNNIKVIASDINQETITKLISARREAEKSYETIKSYVENEPELRKVFEDAAKSMAAKGVLLNNSGVTPAQNVTVLQAPGLQVPSGGPSIIIPGFNKEIVPFDQKVEIPNGQINSTIIPAFDPKIPFSKRWEDVLKTKEEREAKGELFHKSFDKVAKALMEGDRVYLFGPPGCGKTHMMKQIGGVLGVDFVENGAVEDLQSIMACFDVNGRFRATNAFLAVLYGRILGFDEFDIGDPVIQMAIKPLFDAAKDKAYKPDTILFINFAKTLQVPVNANFRIMATGNTTGGGGNSVHNARSKSDEAVQQIFIPIGFEYDDILENRVFGNYISMREFFRKFRYLCNMYCASQGLESAQGNATTRDADEIVRYLNNNSKSSHEIFEQKFVQTKDANYLSYIKEEFKKLLSKDDLISAPLDIPAGKQNEKQLIAGLIYCCEEKIKELEHRNFDNFVFKIRSESELEEYQKQLKL